MDNWISCDERYPDEKTDGLGGYSPVVIVTDGKSVWTSNWWGPLKQWNEDDYVTHWQPLPNPPNTQQETDIWDEIIGV